jgi:TolB protein
MSRLSKAMLVVGTFSLTIAMSSLAGATGSSQSRRGGKRVDTRIVFANNHICAGGVGDCGRGEIAVINLNRSGFRRLTHNETSEASPAWSPLKRRIVFARDFRIWLMDANGHHQRKLTDTLYAGDPDWSPNGRQIVFSGSLATGNSGLWTLNVATGRKTRVFSDKASADVPAWSPDGTRIAFGSNRSGSEQIWILRLRDHHLTQLTQPTGQPPEMSYMPAWSPDGRRLAVWRAGYIWVIRADGNHARRVGGPADEFTWSADGKWMVFTEKSLYAVHPDGSGRHLLRHEGGRWMDTGADG